MAGRATTLVLLDTFVAVLVIYAARFFVREDFVSFGNINKFLGGGLVSTGRMSAGKEAW